MDPITIGLLIGAATGMLKGAGDQQKEASQRKVASETARWSPWTRLNPGPIQQADMVGSTMQGALTGASMSSQFGGGKPAEGVALGDNQVPMQGAQNAAPGPQLDYSTPGGSGFAGYPGAGVGARPAYPWGQLR